MLKNVDRFLNKPVYTNQGTYLGTVKNVVLDVTNDKVNGLYITGTNPILVEDSVDIVVPWRWIGSISDIITLKYFPGKIKMSGGPVSGHYIDLTETEREVDKTEIEHQVDKTPKSFSVKVAEIYRYEDLGYLIAPVYNGNMLLLDFSPIVGDDFLLRRITTELRQMSSDIGGDIAGIGKNILVITPNGVKIVDKVRIEEIYRYEDLSNLTTPVYNGNILLLDFSPIAGDDFTLRRIITELKQMTTDINGDIAGIGKNLLIVTPSGVKVEREKIRGIYNQYPDTLQIKKRKKKKKVREKKKLLKKVKEPKKMMRSRCSQCGYQNPLGASFCSKCGKRLKKKKGKGEETRIYDNDTKIYE